MGHSSAASRVVQVKDVKSSVGMGKFVDLHKGDVYLEMNSDFIIIPLAKNDAFELMYEEMVGWRAKEGTHYKSVYIRR